MAPPRRSEEDIQPELGAALSSIANALAAMQQNQQRFEESVRRNEFAPLPPPPKRGDIKSFLKFNPRQFDVSDQPLDADDWLREMSRLLATADVPEQEWVKCATHLLKGDAALWWENYLKANCTGFQPTWGQFTGAFKEQYLSEIVMERMKEVFLNLKQGNDNVNTYIRNFMNLSRYGGDEISDDKKKQKRFRQGLNASIKYAITHARPASFLELQHTALQEEASRQVFEESKKHNRDAASSSAMSTPSKRRVWVPNTPRRSRLHQDLQATRQGHQTSSLLLPGATTTTTLERLAESLATLLHVHLVLVTRVETLGIKAGTVR